MKKNLDHSRNGLTSIFNTARAVYLDAPASKPEAASEGKATLWADPSMMPKTVLFAKITDAKTLIDKAAQIPGLQSAAEAARSKIADIDFSMFDTLSGVKVARHVTDIRGIISFFSQAPTYEDKRVAFADKANRNKKTMPEKLNADIADTLAKYPGLSKDENGIPLLKGRLEGLATEFSTSYNQAIDQLLADNDHPLSLEAYVTDPSKLQIWLTELETATKALDDQTAALVTEYQIARDVAVGFDYRAQGKIVELLFAVSDNALTKLNPTDPKFQEKLTALEALKVQAIEKMAKAQVARAGTSSPNEAFVFAEFANDIRDILGEYTYDNERLQDPKLRSQLAAAELPDAKKQLLVLLQNSGAAQEEAKGKLAGSKERKKAKTASDQYLAQAKHVKELNEINGWRTV